LSRLVSKSLVVVDSEFAGDRRYRFLETVRQYARERLVQAGAADRLRGRHFEFFFNEFRGAMPILRHHAQLPCLRRLRIEQENVRAALEWALTSSALGEKGVELAGALFWFWTKRGLYEEGKLWLEQALAVDHVAPALRARALIGLAHMHTFRGRHVETGALATEALSLGRENGDAWVVSFAVFLQGLAAFELGDHERAATLALEARDAANAYGDELHHGGPLLILANIAVLNGDHDRAQQLYDESIEVHRRAGEAWGLSILLSAAAGVRIVRTTSIRRARRPPRRCRSVRSSRIHAGLPGASTCSRACWPPKDTPMERPGCGVRRTDCWRASADRWCHPSGGSGIVISSL
jgi:non-specific serine/threonine protein kinase